MYTSRKSYFARVILFLLFFQNVSASVYFDRGSLGAGSVNVGGVNGNFNVEEIGNDGALKYTYKIKLPNGRNGIQPNIDLQYNSNLKNNQNWLGYGWDIKIPKIERQNKNGVARLYTDNNFSSNIYGELELNSSLGANVYIAKKNDVSLAEFKKVGANFEVVDNTGKKYIYTGFNDYVWYLSEVQDEWGNGVEYKYFKDGECVYIDEIIYTNNRKENLAGLYKVKFNWAERADKITSFQTGKLTENKLIVKNIEIYIVENGLNKKRYEYGFRYGVGVNGVRSMLAGITETGIGENGERHSLPEYKFGYSQSSVGYKNIGVEKENFDRIVDVNDDGLLDYVFSREYLSGDPQTLIGTSTFEKYAYINKGNFIFQKENISKLSNGEDIPALSHMQVESGLLSQKSEYFLDLNGDDRVDILSKGSSGVLRVLNLDGDRRPDISYDENGQGNVRQTVELNATQYMDVNADGLDDKIYTADFNEFAATPIRKVRDVYLNVGGEYVSSDIQTDLPANYLSHYLNGISVYNNLIVDVNADGLQDIVAPFVGAYINIGLGFKRVEISDQLLKSFDGGYAADLNGDGLQEIVTSKIFRILSGELVNVWSPTAPSDLLVSVIESSGLETSYEYEANTEKLAGFSSWNVVKKTINNKNITTYKYFEPKMLYEQQADGFYESEFAGYRRVEVNYQNGQKHFNFYRQNSNLDIGLLERQEIYDSQNKLVSERSFEYIGKENLPKKITGKEYSKDGSKFFEIKTENFYDQNLNKIKVVENYSDQTSLNTIIKTTENVFKPAANVINKYLLVDTKGPLSRTSFIYNGLNQPIEIHKYTSANEKLVEKKVWDTVGNLQQDIGINGGVTKYIYDTSKNFIVEMTNPLNQSTKKEYDKFLQKETVVTGVDGVSIKTEYDPFGRPSMFYKKAKNATVWNLLEENKYTNSYSGEIVGNKKYFDTSSVLTVSYKDNLGNLIKQEKENYLGNTVTKEYIFDENNNLVKEVLPTGKTKEYIYDEFGRVIQNKNDLGVESIIYNLGEKTLVDKAGVSKKYSYDIFGNLVQVVNENGEVTKYEYDLNNNLTKITDAIGQVRTFAYDYLGRKLSDTSSLMGTYTYKYDSIGKVKEIESSAGKLVENFDILGRKVSEQGIVSNQKVLENKWVYDTCSPGSLCIASSTDGVVQRYMYDAFGNIAKEEININSSANNRKIWNPSFVTYYKYDLAGNITEEGTGTATTTKNYNKNYLQSIFYEDKKLGKVNVLSDIEYNDLDQIVKYKRGETITTNSFDLDKLNRLTRIQSNFATTTQDLNFNYDSLSRINKINNNEYSYDSIGQLLSAKLGTSTTNIEDFTYLENGDVKTKNSENIGKYYGNLGIDDFGRVTKKQDKNFVWDLLDNLKEVQNKVGSSTQSVKYFYDVNGIRKLTLSSTTKTFTPSNSFLQSDQGVSQIIHFNDKPITSVESGSELVSKISTSTKEIILNISTTTNILNLQNLKVGQKQSVTVNWGRVIGLQQPKITTTLGKATIVPTINKNRLATTTTFSFTPFTSEARLTVSIPNLTPQNFILDLKIASTTVVENISTTTQSYNRIYTLITDHLNSIQKTTDFYTGKVVDENEYLSYGKVGTSSQSISNKKFTGHEDEQDKTGLIYMKGRYYDPELSIFLSPDPSTQNINENIKLLENPSALNPHTYAWNNPVNAFDPNGKLTIVVPGTWHRDEVWNTQNRLYLNAQATFGETPILFNNLSQWSGGNNHNDRMLAGNNLADLINNHEFAPGEQLNIVAHSHGGNVAKIASHMLNDGIQIDNLITLGTPVRPDYPTNMSVVSNMVEVYSNNDFVQSNGGNQFQHRALYGYLWNRGRSTFDLDTPTFERGPAARFENQSNAVDVTSLTTQTFTGSRSHGELHSVNAVWNFIYNN